MSEYQQIDKTKAIALISTGKYKQYVQDLITQIDENFLTDYKKTIFLFTDERQNIDSISPIAQIKIPSYKFPEATLFRFRIFHNIEAMFKHCSHIFYMDIDSAVVGKVGNEFIVDEGLGAVRHPGFYVNDGWGDNNNPKESKSYLPKELRRHYYCGGVQSGTKEAYLEACKVLSQAIDEDEKNGVRSEWNDETFWNHYIHTSGVKITEFPPSYCMVEQPHLREAWGISNLQPYIIALEKDHIKMRS